MPLERKNLDEEKLKEIFKGYECSHSDRITSIFKMYRTNDYIYPDILGRNLKISDTQAYDILDKLVEAGMAEKFFQCRCPNCGKYFGFFKKEPDKDVFCLSCNSILDKQDKRYIYKCL